jgi:hypothetical protein
MAVTASSRAVPVAAILLVLLLTLLVVGGRRLRADAPPAPVGLDAYDDHGDDNNHMGSLPPPTGTAAPPTQHAPSDVPRAPTPTHAWPDGPTRGPIPSLAQPPRQLWTAAELAEARAVVAAEQARLAALYPAAVVDAHSERGAGLAFALGPLLTGALVRQTPFVVGITGGSSTADQTGWPTRLGAWLSTRARLPHATVRNAAQGTTSQLVTSPCLRPLVGDGVHLLLWEFAMNDEYEFISNDVGPDFPMRRRVAEAYLRAAIAFAPAAIGWVHIWDLTIRDFAGTAAAAAAAATPSAAAQAGTGGGGALPNRAYGPTTAIVRAYAPVYNSTFSFDLVSVLAATGRARTKAELTVDAHHPTSAVHDVIADLVATQLLAAWAAWLSDAARPPFSSPTASDATTASRETPRLWDFPLVTQAAHRKVLPGLRLHGHCAMAMPPQFATVNTLVPAALEDDDANGSGGSGGYRTANGAGAAGLVDRGKASPYRADRQLRYLIPACTDDGSSGGRVFWSHVPRARVRFMLLDCGLWQGAACRSRLVVHWPTGERLAPNTPVDNDILSAFYEWVHAFGPDQGGSGSSSSRGHEEEDDEAALPYAIRVCPVSLSATDAPVYLSRLVLLEEMP